MTHILVIDNDLAGRMMLADTVLAADGEITVATAVHGRKSLGRYDERHPDLIVAEIRKQELDGIATIQSFRDLDGTLPVLLTSRGLPVLLLSHGLSVSAFDQSATVSGAPRECNLLSAVRACLAHSAPPPFESGAVR